ncbi:protein kinase family protein [Paludifilum halophilum]|nr:protein kinase family protein [Paludifilum halophilum]
MNMKKKGEWIRDTYQVLNAFPFVQGVLYYTQVVSKSTTRPEDASDHPTRFIHGIDIRYLERGARLEALLQRDRSSFFPLQGLFVEDGMLYQVFGKLEGTLMAHHLYQSVPFSLQEALFVLKEVSGHLVRMDDKGQFTLVHPQNMLLTGDSVRFLYGGPSGVLPKLGAPSSQSEDPAERERRRKSMDVYSVGALAYIMLTGASPATEGEIDPIAAYRGDVPSELEDLVVRSLSMNPLQRPQMADWWRWIQTVSVNNRDFQKKKDDPVYYLKPDIVSLQQSLFHRLVSEPVPPERPESAMDPDEMEGWQAGELDSPGAGGPGPSEEKPKGQMVWSKDGQAGGPEPLTSPSTPAIPEGKTRPTPPKGRKPPFRFDPVSDSSEKESRQPFFFKRKPVWITAVTLFVMTLGFVYLFASGTLGTPDSEAAAQYYGESMKLLDQEKLDAAISQAKEAVHADPEEKTYLLHLAKLYWEKEEYRKAVDTLEQGVEKIPDAEVYEALAIYALKADDLDRAEKAIDQAISMDEENPQFYYHRGRVDGARKEYAAAVRSFKKAIRLDPKDARYHNSLSTYLLKEGDYKEAKDHARKATELDPEVDDYWVKLGKAQLADRGRISNDKELSSKEKESRAKDRSKKAIRAFNQAVELEPKNATAYYYLSISQYYYEDYESAEKSARRSVRLSPKVASFRYQYGVVLQRLDKRKKAAENYEKALKLDPGNMLYKKAVEQIQ